jgi:hypothetical protein
MKTFDTVLQALTELKSEGFSVDFNLKEDSIHSPDAMHTFKPDEFEIVRIYRFEGMSDPDENAVVYAIESIDHGIKGTLVNSYGIYADSISAELAEKLNISSSI